MMAVALSVDSAPGVRLSIPGCRSGLYEPRGVTPAPGLASGNTEANTLIKTVKAQCKLLLHCVCVQSALWANHAPETASMVL